MNIYSAIRNLRDGQAVKPSNWRGYVERIDKPIAEADYGTSPSYAVGNKAKYNNRRYVCITAVADSTEAFDSAKWLAIGQDYNIVFVDSEDTTSGETPPTPNPSAIYTAEIGTSNESVVWHRLGPTEDAPYDVIPDEVLAVHPGWTIQAPVDMPDVELFKAILSDAWESGNATDYETQRTGGGGRW